MNAPTNYCANCGAPLAPDARFCDACGSPAAATPPPPPAMRQAPPPAPPPIAAPAGGQVYCPSCGATNARGAAFCNSCGARLGAPAAQPAAAAPAYTPPAAPAYAPAAAPKSSVGFGWWLLPFFFMWLGGVIAWASVKKRNKGTAIGLLIFGIVWSIVLIIILTKVL